MSLFVILLLAVGCWGSEWKPINDFNATFRGYLTLATHTISTIESILEESRTNLQIFLNNTYSNNPIITKLSKLKVLGNKCYTKFIDQDNLKMSLQIQNYQLQIPLHSSIVNIREKLNHINSSLEIYERMAESKFLNCKSPNCSLETNDWLKSAINSLSCAIYPNCSYHSIQKRSTCLPGQFKCTNGQCISGSYFCDFVCQCSDCSDQPPGCVRHCYEFRCRDTFRCVSLSKKCDGFDDCGDGSDEDGCPPPTTPVYTHANCSQDAGDFLCKSKQCIALEQVCDGYEDCGDGSDEDSCDVPGCSPECAEKGGVCFTEPNKSRCLYECPPGTYETSKGCSRNPEAPLPTLIQVIEDTPRLTARYAARLKFLKTKTIITISKSLREVVKCKKNEFTSLSQIIDFSTLIHEEEEIPEKDFDLAISDTEDETTSTDENYTEIFTNP